MEQYQSYTVNPTTVNTRAEPLTEVLVLQNQVTHLQNTIALQSRQIRRLESAVQVLESLVNSRLR
jgi:predicted  nucleic acid-binding Zn-ribbon protein